MWMPLLQGIMLGFHNFIVKNLNMVVKEQIFMPNAGKILLCGVAHPFLN